MIIYSENLSVECKHNNNLKSYSRKRIYAKQKTNSLAILQKYTRPLRQIFFLGKWNTRDDSIAIDALFKSDAFCCIYYIHARVIYTKFTGAVSHIAIRPARAFSRVCICQERESVSHVGDLSLARVCVCPQSSTMACFYIKSIGNTHTHTSPGWMTRRYSIGLCCSPRKMKVPTHTYSCSINKRIISKRFYVIQM